MIHFIPQDVSPRKRGTGGVVGESKERTTKITHGKVACYPWSLQKRRMPHSTPSTHVSECIQNGEGPESVESRERKGRKRGTVVADAEGHLLGLSYGQFPEV